MANIVNAERVSKSFGTRTLLDEVSLGLGRGDVVGVVGRNGDGKSTLLNILTGRLEPDAGQVTRTGNATIGHLGQDEDFAPDATVRDVIVGGRPDHVWAANATTRGIVEHLLAEIDLDAPVSTLSGGERRRVSLVALMLGGYDLIVLDEPTNHLDVEAVAWLADHLRALARDVAMLVVSHDRWFLDAICTRVWEVHDATVDAYEGGYAAYVLARAERGRQAAVTEGRRKNLLRKELAWLRRGPPARTSKPKFRIDAANSLIADEPPPRDSLSLQQFAVSRLGKDVFDLHHLTKSVPVASADPDAAPGVRTLIDRLDWSIGPGDRIGLVGVNGAGKTTLLRLLTGEAHPDSGRVKRGRTLRIGHLSQAVTELDESERVLDSVNRLQQQTRLATGRDASASSLLEEFGFTGERLVTRIGDLSGGERRRLQFLRLLLEEPNVLLLDEPTNDLDIDTLTVLEDYLDTWPGTLIVVTHDRYFLERVCDVTYALMGDGRCVLLPGGVEQYLEARRASGRGGAARPGGGGAGSKSASASPAGGSASGTPTSGGASSGGAAASPAQVRQARKDLARIEGQLAKVTSGIERVHHDMAGAAADYERLVALQAELQALEAQHESLEEAWLETAELLPD